MLRLGLAGVVIASAAVVGVIGAAPPASAAISSTRCVVEPVTSTGSQSGVTAVAAGEVLQVAAEVDLDAGVVYQDIVANPDGSVYFASWLGVAPAAGSLLLADFSSLSLTVDGVSQVVLAGSEPSPAGFVLDTAGDRARVFFPGDPAAMLADPTGHGEPSYTVPGGGQTFRLSYSATVPDAAAGEVLAAASCQAGISYGEANAAVDEREVSVALLGIDADVAKTADLPVLAPSSVVTYSIEVAVPEFDAAGEIRSGTAFDTVVTDDLPDGLEYVAGSASHGGTESGGVLTWNIPAIDAGDLVTLTYQLAVPADAPIGSEYTNDVSVVTTSQPGAVPGEATTTAATDSVTLVNGAEAPTIAKTAGRSIAGTGEVVGYDVEITWPAGSTWYDVTLTDLLPDGLAVADPGAIVCAPEACPGLTTLAPYAAADGTSRFGSFVGELGPFAAPQTWHWTYTATMTGTRADGTEMPLASELGNVAELRFNLIPRLGGLTPNPAHLNEYDGVVEDGAPVTYDRPVIAIAKQGPSSDVDLDAAGVEYTVTLVNSGGVEAQNVTFRDPAPFAAGGYRLGVIATASVQGATFVPASGTFTVASVPANGSIDVTYRVVGAAADAVAVEAPYENSATLTEYRDPAGNVYTSTDAAVATAVVQQPELTVTKERISASPIAGTDGETISYRVTVTNDGLATAHDITGADELGFPGTFVPGSCTNGMTVSAAGGLALDELAPGATANCTYDVVIDGDQPEGALTNSATLAWRNGFNQTGVWEPETGVRNWVASDDAAVEVVHPRLALEKGPEAGAAGNFIVNGGTAAYTVSIVNVSAVTARDVVLTDALPGGLSLESTPVVVTTPGGLVHTVAGGAGDATFEVALPALGPGELVQVSVPVRHDGVEPADDQLVNAATLTADGVPEPLTDTGVLQWMPAVNLPLASKSVSPTSAGIGAEVTWTVTATVQENAVAVYDVAFVDTLPRGMTFTGYEATSCDGPLCATTPAPATLTAEDLPTGETLLGWFVGDVPADTALTTYTFTFTASVDATYRGVGSPPDGSSVTDTNLINRIQPWFTVTASRDDYNDSSLPDLSSGLSGQFERRAAVSTAALHVVTPRVIVEKEPTNLGEQLVWETEESNGAGWMANPGDDVSYEVTFRNVGGTTAFDVQIVDTMGQPASGEPMLRDVTVSGLPAGVTVVDGWSIGDPDVVFAVDELAAGAQVSVTYSGVVATSAELVPGFSGDNRDVALIRNLVAVAEFNSAPGGAGLSFVDSFSGGADVYVYTPSPWLVGAACVGSATSPAGTTATFWVNARNGAPPFGELNGTLLTTGYPSDPTVGVGVDSTLTVTLGAGVRYAPGTARIGGALVSDPVVGLDGSTGRQTLTFTLGELAQNTADLVTFDVRTIANGAQGGMTATLAMEDVTGSPSRGTGVVGVDYLYQHTIVRGCQPGEPLGISKFPDLSSRYEGKKIFTVGETVQWSGTTRGDGAPYHDAEFIDTLPAGLDYVAGSAAFTVVLMNGAPVTVSAANGNLTEVVTPLPDNRTEIRYTSPVFAEFARISYSLETVVGDDVLLGVPLTNVIYLNTNDGLSGLCADSAATVCDSGAIQVMSDVTPTVVKSVDHSAGPWGDTFSYTIDVTLPGNATYFDAFVGDSGTYPQELDPAEPFANSTIVCLSGCDTDPAPVAQPVYRSTEDFARAWYLGDLAAQLAPRVYRITYDQTFADKDEYQAVFGVDPVSEAFTNRAIAGFNDTQVLNDANYQEGGAAYAPATSFAFGVNGVARSFDDATVDVVRPELAVDKQCQALAGRDDFATSTSFNGETSGTAPNFRCVLTVTNTTNDAVSTRIVDPVIADTLPTLSAPGNRPVRTQLIFWDSDQAAVAVDETEVVGTTLVPPALSSLNISAPGVSLAPGESYSITLDLRVSASDAFWSAATLTSERSVNVASPVSFADDAGNEYAGSGSDSWNLVITKPDLTVSERGWAPGGYEASLADGRATACMAYAVKPDPLGSSRVFGTFGSNACSALPDARRDEGTPGGEYGRAYGGGAPDVVLGSREPVTWAVDAAVVDPASLTVISVADKVPYGFEYVPGSARLAHWNESGTTHTALADPLIGATPVVTCSSVYNVDNLGAAGQFHSSQISYGQAPWTPVTWSFAPGVTGPESAFWDDDLAYLSAANRDAAGVTAQATPFDRLVRVVFEIRPRAEFDACLQTPQRANSFRSEATATGTHARGTVASTSVGWVVGVELARVQKGPDDGIAPDGTTAAYGIDVTITDPTLLRVEGSSTSLNSAPFVQAGSGALCDVHVFPTTPTRTPWIGLGDPSRTGLDVTGTFTGNYDPAFGSELVVTDTILDDGQYVPGSATFQMVDPWGRPFTGHLESEQIERTLVDGRQAATITWTFDYYPSPLNLARGTRTFPCGTPGESYITYPSSMQISVPLPIPDDTPDGTLLPNSASVTVDHLSGDTVVRTQQAGPDDALITVRNPLPPPPATKTAIPDDIVPGTTFQWVLETELQAGAVWLDLGWVDRIPASMELVGYGTSTCVLSGTATPCSAPALVPTTLTPVDNPDGSTTVGWYVGDVLGAHDARTLRMPITVRFTGDEIAGEQLTNVVTGFSNDDDLVDSPTSPPDPATFAYVSEPVVGTATVIEPSLSIDKTVTNGPGPFQEGDVVEYAITVTNNGDATAYDVAVVDVSDSILTSLTTDHPARSKGWTPLDPRVEWFLPTLAPDETVTLDLSGVVAAGYLELGIVELSNTVTVPEYTSLPASNNAARAYPAVQDIETVALVAPNLGVTKYAGPGCTEIAHVFLPGEPVEWCVVVTNTGTAPAYDVTLTDLLPPGWSYENDSADIDGNPAAPTVGSAAGGGERLEWTLGDIEPDTQLVITYRTMGVDGDALVTNTAIATSALEDGTRLPNVAGLSARGAAHAAALGAGLEIAKLPDQQRVRCDTETGCDITWQIVVVNAEDQALTATELVDYLPAGLTYSSSVDATGWSDATVATTGSGPSDTTPITWTHTGSFESGTVATFEITATVPPGDTERAYLNHAVAGADGVPDVENQALAEVYSTASLGDTVWNDLDRDGRQDPGEPGRPGIGVELYSVASAAVIATTVTDANGHYHFGDLDPGVYRVRILVPTGWVTSPRNAGSPDGDSDIGTDGWSGDITLTSGAADITRDAGLSVPPPDTNPPDTTPPTTTPPATTPPTTTPPTSTAPTSTPPTSTTQPAQAGQPEPQVPSGELPSTGGNSMSLLLPSTLLLLAGTLGTVIARRGRVQRRRAAS